MAVWRRLGLMSVIGLAVLTPGRLLHAAMMDGRLAPVAASPAFDSATSSSTLDAPNMLVPFDGLSAIRPDDPSALFDLGNGLIGRTNPYSDPAILGADPSIVSGLLGDHGPGLDLGKEADPWLLVPVPAEEGLTASEVFRHAPLPAALPLLVTGMVALYSLRRCKRRRDTDDEI